VNDMVYSLAEKWQEAIKNASKAKRRRFSDSIQSNEKFFQPVSRAEAYPCDNCGSDIEKNELKAIKKGEEEKYCLSCHKFIKTGNKLKSADILIEFIQHDLDISQNEKIFYPIEGIPIGYILTNEKQLDDDAALVHQASHKKIYYLNQTDFLKDLTGERFTAYARGFKFYGGNHLPLNDKGEPATFDYLAGARENKAEETTGFKRLGVLRMDVDNLGQIFQRGFLFNKLRDGAPIPTPTYSISRLTTLSSLLDFFFCGYLNTLHQKEDFKDLLYILYSGGDDLFIVGRWDKAIDFAALIREEFKKFTCWHPDISITGGVALTPPKYPIHRSAELAGDAESQAKSLKRKVNGKEVEKDAFCFLGKSLSWNDFRVAKALKDDLCQWICEPSEGKGNMNRGLLSRLAQIYETYQKEAKIINEKKTLSEQDRAEMIQYNKWRWRLVYSLSRFQKQNKEYENEIKSIQNALIASNSYKGLHSERPIIEYLDIPVQWAEFTLRTNKKEDVL
ncbi:MAG: type III-A CRISPR-associated protein Cas10/Csm1, partial [archaeon]